MTNTRSKRAKLNIVVSLLGDVVALICGLIVPRLLLGAFGSEAYGATSSITQFLAYIALLEGGICGVARAALYKPLAENNITDISKIICEIKRFFRIVALIFVPYVVALAFAFPYISNVKTLDQLSTFVLVIVISISTFFQYFIGISYSVLLQAAQKVYITKIVSMFSTVLNAIVVVILISFNCNLIVVKLGSSIVFILKPIIMWLYVKKHFRLLKNVDTSENILKQKWTALGQHIAYFLHSNTDVAVLTVFADLGLVAIYSVYYMVTNSIQIIASSFSSGMESVFGDMLSKREDEQLQRTFGYYETLISWVSVVLFSVTAVLIIPFVKLYTAGITDANYIQPYLAMLLILSSMIYCFRMPYHSMTIASGHFKQTRFAAYGEAVLNIVLSIILVIKFKLTGVAIATLVAVSFRFIYYVVYLSKNIICRPIKLFAKRTFVNFACVCVIYIIGSFIISYYKISSYFRWVIAGIIVFAVAAVISTLLYIVFYKSEMKSILKKHANYKI